MKMRNKENKSKKKITKLIKKKYKKDLKSITEIFLRIRNLKNEITLTLETKIEKDREKKKKRIYYKKFTIKRIC